MQVLIRGQVYTLTEGVPVQVAVGETIRVFYSFQYRALQGATVQLWASLYRYSLGVLDRMAQAQTKTCLLYTSPSPRDAHESRMPSSA